MEKQGMRDNGNGRGLRSSVLMLAAIALVAGAVAQSAQAASARLIGETNYMVSGRVATATGTGVAGVQVSGYALIHGGPGTPTEVPTDSNGVYVINLTVEDIVTTITITPTSPYHDFLPAFDEVSVDTANTTGTSGVDFTATLKSTSVNAIAQTAPGVGLPGVLMTVADQSGPVTSNLTNTSGVAVLTVPAIFNGTVTPFKTGYEFTPTTAALVLPNPSATDIVFDAVVSARTFIVSGEVHIGSSLGPDLAGVTVAITGDALTLPAVQTDAEGRYAFNVPVNATNVTITPTLANYVFTPPNATFIVITADTTQNFVATQTAIPVNISGTITGVTGVNTPVTLTAADTSGVLVNSVTVTGPYDYSLPVPTGFNGTITPASAGLTFRPASISFLNNPVTTDTLGQNFAVVVFATINGAVRLPVGTFATTVTVTVSDAQGVALSTTQGLTSGAVPSFIYAVSVPTPFSGYIAASAPGWNFLPFRRAYDKLISGRNAQDFDGIAAPTAPADLLSVYNILYKRDGRGKPATAFDGSQGITVSSGSIIIAGSSDKDTLMITIQRTHKNDPSFPAIRLVQTDKGLANFTTFARVDTLTAKGLLGKITTTNASIGKIDTTGAIGIIAMTDNKPNPVTVISAITASGASVKRATVKLLGIKLEILVTPATQAFALVQLETKKYKVVGSRPAQFTVSQSGFVGGAGATNDLQAGLVNSIVAKGAVVAPNTMIGQIKKISGLGLALNNETYPADISIGYLHAMQNIAITAAGGDIEPGFYLVDGKISAFSATVKKTRILGSLVEMGGVIGNRNSPTTTVAVTSNALTTANLVVVVSGLKPITPARTGKDITTIKGQVNTAGLFIAGGVASPDTINPTVIQPTVGAGGRIVSINSPAGTVRVYGDVAKTKKLPRTSTLQIFRNNDATATSLP